MLQNIHVARMAAYISFEFELCGILLAVPVDVNVS